MLHLNTAMTKLMANPLVKQAGLRLTDEIATVGLIGLIDNMQDRLAKRIAMYIVDQEEKNKENYNECKLQR